MKKGQMCEGVIEYIDFPNKGRVKVEDQYVTVKNGIPGQKIRFVINKKRKDRCEGRLLEVLEKSPLETIEPVCHEFPACGGCMYQTMSYDEQLKMKAGQVKKLLDTAISSAGHVKDDGLNRLREHFQREAGVFGMFRLHADHVAQFKSGVCHVSHFSSCNRMSHSRISLPSAHAGHPTWHTCSCCPP